jgi:hypothetical protein
MRRSRGQATVELAFLTLILAVLVVGLVGASEIVQTQIGLTAVAEEAALAAALAPSVDTVEQRGQERGLAVGTGYALRNGSLSVAIQFAEFAPGQPVRAVATYELTSRDIPLLVLSSVNLSLAHVEVVPQFRGLPANDA